MPYASFSIHNIRNIRASSTGTPGAPLTLNLLGIDNENAHITIFTDNQTLTNRLIEAINRITDHTSPVEGEPATSERGPHPDDYRD